MGKIAKLQEVPTRKLKPYNANAKIHNKTQLEKLKASIKEFGFLSPCLIDGDYNIIAGHGRVQAAEELSMETVPCIFLEDLTEEQRRAYILADNRLTELGEWDRDILSAELAALKDEGFNIELTGFNVDDIIIEEIDFSEIDQAWENAAEEAGEEKEPKTKSGDIYQLGKHRLMCGDATSGRDMKKLRGGQTVQLVITDPPYNIDYQGHRKPREKIENDNRSDSDFYSFLRAAFNNISEALDPGRSFYIWHASMKADQFMKAAEEEGLEIKQVLIWVKHHFVIGRQDYQWRHEPCLYGWKDGAPHYFADTRSLTTVFEKKIDPDNISEEEAKDLLKKILDASNIMHAQKPLASDEHPTMKPINLIQKQIENSSRPGEIVLDPFGGSGTTLVAAEKAERICYMMEYSPAYVDSIIERWQNLTGKKAKKITA